MYVAAAVMAAIAKKRDEERQAQFEARDRAMHPEGKLDCADCAREILLGKAIYWMGTSARCLPCHQKRMKAEV